MTSGAVDNAAADEADAVRQMRKFYSYFPSKVHELPPIAATSDPVNREEEQLLSLVPRQRTRPYNMRTLIKLVVDDGDFSEIQPAYGVSVITALARVDGKVIGIR